MIKKIIISLFTLANISFAMNTLDTDTKIKALYNDLHINNQLTYSTFSRAIKGYNKIENKKDGIITIVDFSKPSNEKRFYVIDLDRKKLDYCTYVSHGKNTGLVSAVKFSNIRNSLQSSLGFFLTSNTYTGNNGYSLRLNGLEAGINSNALDRHIVLHGASYATKEFIDKYGFLGRSLGCPAIPENISTEVIDIIKDGTVLFINADDDYYQKCSHFI